mgnify:CR=1 FL=1
MSDEADKLSRESMPMAVDIVIGGQGEASLLEQILTWLDAKDVIVASFVSHYLKDTALSDVVWEWRCDNLWKDKVYVPEQFKVATLSRVSAYFLSLTDARRCAITVEELCSMEWHSRMKG